MSTFYEHTDKNQGDLLRSNDWNTLSKAVAGNQGLHLALDATDKVGIGTTSPSAKLEINAGNETPLKIRRKGGTHAVGITQNQVGGIATMELTTSDSSGAQATRLLLRGGSDNTDIEFYRGAYESEQVSMFIEGKNGNVGIGTTSPERSLHVRGDMIRIDRNAHSPSLQLIRYSESYDNLWKNFELSVESESQDNGKFHISDRGLTTGSAGANHRITIDNVGNVGIGTTSPGAKLEVSGTIKCTTLTQTSDQNLKANIQPLEQGLQALMNYKPVSYHWKEENTNKKRNYGFLAQDMQSLHADTSIVSGSEEDHGLSISYTQLIPVLTKSIQELSEKVDALAKKVK